MRTIIPRPGAAFIIIIFSLLAFVGSSLAGNDQTQAVRIDVGALKLNSVLLKAGKSATLPPIVFIHGASTSLYDPMYSFRSRLEGRAELLFVDRPGHGSSDMGGPEYLLPDAQADAIARLMKLRGIRKAIIVGHSFGGAIAAEMAVRHPDMVAGLVFLSPALYPWEGGVAWYYAAASKPVTGQLFSTVFVPTLGLLAIDSATRAVFAPNPRPADYISRTHAMQALRPSAFRWNAKEISALNNWSTVASPGYRKIKAPTVIISGDADQIVSPDVQARHLARDIKGARLIVVHNLGHKSDEVANDLTVAAIEHVAGMRSNLVQITRAVERRIATDVRK